MSIVLLKFLCKLPGVVPLTYLGVFLRKWAGGPSKYLSESELSNTESDSEWFSTSVETPVEMPFNVVTRSDDRTDAAIRSVSLPVAEHVITLENVQDIEQELDVYEIVSLVYLLYDTSELALQDLQVLVATGKNSGLLYNWAKSEHYKETKKWQAKIVEALCIVQNYKILRKLGYNKVDLVVNFMPHRAETSYFVNKKRKSFYLIAEKLGKEETMQFIYNMEERLREKEMEIRNYGNEYLELYFLYWEQIHVDIEDVKSTFKAMDLEEFYDMLNGVLPSENYKGPLNANVEVKATPSKVVKKKPKVRRKSTTRDTTYLQQRSIEEYRTPYSGVSGFSQEGPSEGINGYGIDPNNPGIMLIINQEEFYTELDPQYKHLLHEDNDRIKLETREGTMMDERKLKVVFQNRGFKIIIKPNLPHYEIINIIREVTMMVSSESSLIVCVLSHGDNGVVYGANSCRIDVNQIQNIMCKKNEALRGKPKVLILQSCQGKQCQKIEEESSDDEDDETAHAKDGPGAIPATADLLTFWATIPGFAAIRNKYKGSWLIQELCESIETLASRYHFLDICTRVVEKVTNKEWKEKTGTNIMTPMVVTTLRKPFYLPPPRSNQ